MQVLLICKIDLSHFLSIHSPAYKTYSCMVYSNRLVTVLLKMATRLVFAGRLTEKLYQCKYVCIYFERYAMWMYWQKFFQWFYSNDAVSWKAAQALILYVNKTDKEFKEFLLRSSHMLFLIICQNWKICKISQMLFPIIWYQNWKICKFLNKWTLEQTHYIELWIALIDLYYKILSKII